MARPTIFAFALMAALLVTGAQGQAGNCTHKDSSTRPDCPIAIGFFRELQNAMKKDDRVAIASLVSYPVLVRLHGKPTHIRTPAQLLAHFDQIFDSAVRCVIRNSSGASVWGNWQGFTVDGGAIWFDAIIPRGEHPDPKAADYSTKYPFKIITINNESYYS